MDHGEGQRVVCGQQEGVGLEHAAVDLVRQGVVIGEDALVVAAVVFLVGGPGGGGGGGAVAQ